MPRNTRVASPALICEKNGELPSRAFTIVAKIRNINRASCPNHCIYSPVRYDKNFFRGFECELAS